MVTEKSKETFLGEVEQFTDQLSEEALEYFDSLVYGEDIVELSYLGKKILAAMVRRKDIYDNRFTAKIMSQALGYSARSLSGAMKTLENQGCLIKIPDTHPVVYQITSLGEELSSLY